ncbi:MAG: 50S ribosomal protein L15 [Actinomycetota bacterium]
MRLHDLRPAPGAKRPRKRIGRGDSSGRGKTSGRGMKGQKARNNVPAWFEGGQMPLQRRVPKWGGFTSPNRVEYAVVNVAKLSEVFDAGAVVGPEECAARGLVPRRKPVKVLGHGEIAKALTVRAHKFSKQAADKITAAGGTIEKVEGKS